MAYKVTQAEAKMLTDHMQKGREDFAYFCFYVLGITLHEGQVKAWLEIKENGFKSVFLFLCGNRAGKSVFLACYHIWCNFYKIYGEGRDILPEFWETAEYQTANVAPLSQLTIIMYNLILKICRGVFSIRETDGSIRSNQSIIRWFVDDEGVNNPQQAPKSGPYEINFANGAVFRAYTMGGSHADPIQGVGFGLISYDEFGRSSAPKTEVEDLQPRIGEYHGKLFLITTPDENNEESSEYILSIIDKAEAEKGEYVYINWSSEQNPYLGGRTIEIMTAGMSDDKKRQILHGSIIRSAMRYFPFRKSCLIFEQTRVDYQDIDFSEFLPDSNHKYFGGVDTAGLGKDAWSIYVIDYTTKPFKIVYRYASNKATPAENREVTRDVITNFQEYCGSNFRWKIDFTSEGGTIIFDDLRDLNPEPFRFSTERHTGKNMKIDLLETMRRCVHEEALISPQDESLLNQLVMYKGPKNDQKNKTDRLMALAMAVYDPYRGTLNGIGDGNWIVTFDEPGS